ncbi:MULTISPECIES: hypothetical protein [unclassified Serratia (in: enterobacteria)]|uniref:hypothetical protein n=1 Tax=unclassified Serratia (in: enterobacteria) TaxID=2647522 RepID=UPI00046A7D2C|nr:MULTISPECIES: hypothetical protein [unclassified Serratia (in: enterobacteria)]
MKTFWVGVTVTCVYFLLLCITVAALKLNVMTSWNELGDFLAGVFSPVAFLWLVLGYLQQQKELQQNTRALELQAVELKNSVDQYRDMVSVARDQLKMDQESISTAKFEKENQYKPRIKAPSVKPAVISGGVYFVYRGILELAGEDAMNVSIKTEPPFPPFNGVNVHSLKSGGFNLGETQNIHVDSLPKQFVLTIMYESKLGIAYVDKYTYILAEEGKYSIIDDEYI